LARSRPDAEWFLQENFFWPGAITCSDQSCYFNSFSHAAKIWSFRARLQFFHYAIEFMLYIRRFWKLQRSLPKDHRRTQNLAQRPL
jgi:hypothetical protein